MKKKLRTSQPIVNRRARYDFELGDTFVAGLVLSGPEVRGARLGHVRLTGSFANFKNSELWLTNMSITIPPTAQATVGAKELTSPRKLLLSKKQLRQLEEAKKQGMTIVPTKLLNHSRYVKLEIALARGKKRYDKREAIKRREQEIEKRRRIR